MEYNDRVYGKTEIADPVILELMGCPALRRLKSIDQWGNFSPFYPGMGLTRFEHSVGVYLLLKRYGASIEEQVAGLIHDVSHAAFSHCVDYVLANGSQVDQTHQDNIFDEFVRKSEIPAILAKFDFDLDYILNETNFPLKENDLPDLCADRIDYSLRSAMVFGEIKNADQFLDGLRAQNGKWFFRDFESAKAYAELFRRLNAKYYSSLISAVMFQTVGDCLRYALGRGYIDEGDLYSTDDEVLAKVSKFSTQDEDLRQLFDRMNRKDGFKNDPDDYDAEISCKSRMVDPLFDDAGKLRRASDADSEWKNNFAAEFKQKTYFIKFEK